MLDRRSALEAAQARNPDAPGPAHAPEIVPQHVHDHHVLGPVLAAREELAGERPILIACPAREPESP